MHVLTCYVRYRHHDQMHGKKDIPVQMDSSPAHRSSVHPVSITHIISHELIIYLLHNTFLSGSQQLTPNRLVKPHAISHALISKWFLFFLSSQFSWNEGPVSMETRSREVSVAPLEPSISHDRLWFLVPYFWVHSNVSHFRVIWSPSLSLAWIITLSHSHFNNLLLNYYISHLPYHIPILII